ncbi:metal-dependent transcriptional regulator [Halomicrobium katesii]|uniref:metal-dependent transcriptional regulator n=1 Tax=Halomicrobium katesii TaxID=437163 RepID=UPI00036F6928|nr:metal-dependent transcriptional regulator [Halomicrobium katesii]
MERVAQYLVVVYDRELTDGSPVEPGTVARAMGRSPSATTEMLQRLADDGLVDYEPYEGVTLTDRGRERATELYDTYRTLSAFFEEVLELESPEREARAVVDTVSPIVADRLDALLLEGEESVPFQ